MTQEPTILFGVGATKAGTTWLYDYLSSHPDCHLRSIKELHYFDALDAGRVDQQLQSRYAAAGRLLPSSRKPKADDEARQTDLADWIDVLELPSESPDAYLGYLTAGQGDRRVVADITPSYALLSAARLKKMATIAPDTRFVYLMRDPVARLWSHIRMVASRTTGNFPAKAREILRNIANGETSSVTTRGDYAATLTRLQSAIDPQRLLVMFQETLMTTPGVTRLCRFLGIRTQPADFSRRVHEGTPLAMTDEDHATARAFLRSQYDFVARQFSDLPDAWRMNMNEVAR